MTETALDATASSRKSPDALAEEAREALRALNHATFPGRCEFDGSGDLYRVIGSLAALLHSTPQTLRQAVAWLAREQNAGRVSVDSLTADESGDLVAAIGIALDAAGVHAAAAAREVDRAHQAASHIVIDQPDQIGM